MKLEIIILNEISQSHQDKYCMLSPICETQRENKNKVMKIVGELLGSERERGEWRSE
jgi:hypothetical protein